MPPTDANAANRQESAVTKLRRDIERGWAPVLSIAQGLELLELLESERDYAEIAQRSSLVYRDALCEIVEYAEWQSTPNGADAEHIVAVARKALT